MDISIKSGEGISQAIKRELQAEGATNIQSSIWSEIQQLFQNEAEESKSVYTHAGEEKNIGEAWATLRTNVLVFKNDVLKIAEATWNKIKELAGVTAEGAAAAASGGSSSGSASGANGAGDTRRRTSTSNVPQKDPHPPLSEAIPSANAPMDDSNPPTAMAIYTLANYKTTHPEYRGKTIDNHDGTESTYDVFGKLTDITYTSPDALKDKVKLRVFYNADGTVDSYNKTEYDSNGKQIKEVYYNADGTVNYYRKSEYDANGNEIKIVSYDADGTVDSYNKTEYDSNGNQIKGVYYKANGTVRRYWKTEYDANGNSIKDVYYDADGSVNEYWQYEYDSEGNRTKSTHYDPDGTVLEY